MIVPKSIIWLLSFFRKAEIKIEVSNDVQVSKAIEHPGYIELHFACESIGKYEFLWLFLPNFSKSSSSNESLRLIPSDRKGYDKKVILTSDHNMYNFLGNNDNPVNYVFGTQKNFHSNAFLVYCVRPSVFINFNILFWMIKLGV